MWLIHQNAIFIKDNLIKRKWQGDTRCHFCSGQMTVDHLFFECSLAKFIWSVVAIVVGAPCRPCSFDQFWRWAQVYMSGGKTFLMVGLAAICWAIWRSRNSSCFDGKKSDLLLRSFVFSHHFFFFGQNFSRWRSEER